MARRDRITRDGIIVSGNTEDFSKWTWDNPANAVSILAARTALDAIINDAHIQFDLHEGVATVLFGALEFELMLEYPITKMMDYWIDGVSSPTDGKIPQDGDERDRSLTLLHDLEAAIAKLRAAMAPC